MAGSLNHIFDKNHKFTMDTIENMGDAYEALEECFNVIQYLADGDVERINVALKAHRYPTIKEKQQ
jgi:hypothetical protein